VLHHLERVPDPALHAGQENPHYIYSTLHTLHNNRNVGDDILLIAKNV
jgi:hypothetical protein